MNSNDAYLYNNSTYFYVKRKYFLNEETYLPKTVAFHESSYLFKQIALIICLNK